MEREQEVSRRDQRRHTKARLLRSLPLFDVVGVDSPLQRIARWWALARSGVGWSLRALMCKWSTQGPCSFFLLELSGRYVCSYSGSSMCAQTCLHPDFMEPLGFVVLHMEASVSHRVMAGPLPTPHPRTPPSRGAPGHDPWRSSVSLLGSSA